MYNMCATFFLLLIAINFVNTKADDIACCSTIRSNDESDSETIIQDITSETSTQTIHAEDYSLKQSTIEADDARNIAGEADEMQAVNEQNESITKVNLQQSTEYTYTTKTNYEADEEESRRTVSGAENEATDEVTIPIAEITTQSIPTSVVTPYQQSIVQSISDNTEKLYQKAIGRIVKTVEANLIDEIPLIESQQVSSGASIEQEISNVTEPRIERLSHQIRTIIAHYQTYGEVTIPNSNIPDPMPLPDVKKNFGGSPATFTNMTMFGLSSFTIGHVNTDLNKMQVYVLVLMKRLVILGNYSMRSWLGRGAGRFNVTLLDVETEGAAELKRNEDGTLQATDSEMDMSFKDTVVDFKNAGLVGSILQGVLASAAPILFEAIKPTVLKEINDKIREDLNKKLMTISNRLAVVGSRPPLDAAEDEGRKYLKENGYDPYHIKDFKIKQKNVIGVNISEIVLEGLSDFHRVGEVVLAMDEGTIQMGVHVAALDLVGRCKWALQVGKSFKKEGYVNFTIDHIQVRAFVNQSLDVKTKPKLDKLDMNVGKIKLNMDGAGRFDIIVEVIVNTLPDLIRHIIVDAIEEPLRFKVQQILNKVEPDIILEKTLPELDNMGL